jgi:hypothetical protein
MRFLITDAIRACLEQSPTLNITFIAQGAGGTPAPARSASAITIATPTIIALPRARDVIPPARPPRPSGAERQAP